MLLRINSNVFKPQQVLQNYVFTIDAQEVSS